MSKTYEYICNYCKKSFQTTRKSSNKNQIRYCSRSCSEKFNHEKHVFETTKNILKTCENCNKEFFVSIRDIKNKNIFFCSQSCVVSYNNKHRKFSPEKRLQINEKIKQSLKKINDKKPITFKKCIICNKLFSSERQRKTCSDECYKIFLKDFLKEIAPLGGGYRQGSSRGHHGYYKGYWCDSTYELAYLIYCLDHNIKIERCKESFEYEIDGKKRKYHPDFIVDDEIIEIKNFHRDDVEIKINAVKKLNRKIKVLYYEDLIEVFEYVAKTYKKEFKNKGNNFYELYDK